MADVADALPIFQETITSIRARLDADANAGVDPNDRAFLDLSEGGIYYDLSQTFALEAERLWEALSAEVPAAMFPKYAWGEYLDEHGATVDLPRKDEVKATGAVTFTATAAATSTLIPTGTQVATVQTDPDADPIVFSTTQSGTLPGSGGTVTLPVEAAVAGATGNVGAGTVTTLISPINVASVTNANAMSGGADVESDDLYRGRILLEWTAPRGGGTQADYVRWALAYAPIGRAVVEPLWEGPGSVRVIVTDQAGSPVSGTVLTGLKNVLDPEVTTTVVGVNAVNSATLNVTSTAGFPPTGRFRLGGVLTAYTGLTATTLTGCGNHAATTGGEAIQSAGLGAGLAPIGATVTVASVTTVNVDVAAVVSYLSGYSRDGTAGTIAIGPTITAAIKQYIDHLNPGDDVIREHVIAQFFTVLGVYDVSTVTLNGSAANVAITALQVAHTNVVTLT